MNKVISLVEALEPRAKRVAEELSRRLPDAGLWANYNASEGLVGELRLASLLTFHRPKIDKAVLVFRNPRMAGMRQVDWGEPIVLEANVASKFSSYMLLDQPIEYNKKISHTFSKTRTLDEQLKAGLEVALKAGVEAGSSGGIHGITAKVYAEISAKMYAEYQRQWGSSTTQSRTVEDSFKMLVTPEGLNDGPIKINYEAERTLNVEQRTIRADCDYEHSVELIDETGAGENPPRIQLVCPSWAAFRNVAQGFAPMDYETGDERVLQRTAFYDEFIHNPLRGEALETISSPAKGAIELLVEYDNVLKQNIQIV